MKRGLLLAIGLVLLMADISYAKVVWLTTNGDKQKVKGIRADAPSLPEALVVAPGLYTIGRYAYTLRPGGNRTPQGYRIAFNGARSIISAVAWQTEQRTAVDDFHEQSRVEWAETEMMYRKLDVGCGVSAWIAIDLLGQQGIAARRVALVPAQEFLPTDGHTLMEVFTRGRWQVYDTEYDMRPLSNGKPVRAMDYPRTPDFTFDWIAGDSGRFVQLPPNYARQMGTSLIEFDGGFFFTDPVAGHTKEDLYAFRNGWYHYLPPAEFAAHFYGA